MFSKTHDLEELVLTSEEVALAAPIPSDHDIVAGATGRSKKMRS